jgi:hypothetical protein
MVRHGFPLDFLFGNWDEAEETTATSAAKYKCNGSRPGGQGKGPSFTFIGTAEAVLFQDKPKL